MPTELRGREQVYEELKARQTWYANLHREQETDDAFINAASYWMRSPIRQYLTGLPQGYRVKVTPWAKLVLNRAVNQVYVGQTPHVSYELPENYHRDPERAAQHKAQVEAFLQACLDHIDSAAALSPIKDSTDQCLGLGQAVVRFPVRAGDRPQPPDHGRETDEERDAWARYERQQADWFPWDVDSRHPTWIFPDPFNDPPHDFIEEEEVDEAEMARRYPHLGLDYQLGRSGRKTVKKVSYCSPEYYGSWVDEKPLLTAADGADGTGMARNPKGRVWYAMAWSGFGKRDRLNSPELAGVGIIRDGRDLFLTLIQNENLLSLIKQRYGNPDYEAFKEGMSKGSVAEELADWEPGGGALVTHSGVTIRPIANVEIPRIVFDETTEKKAAMEMLFGPGVLSGVHEDEPAIAQRTRAAMARAPYRFPKQNLEQMWATVLEGILADVRDEIGEPVTVRHRLFGAYTAVTLRPEDVVPGGRVVCDFSPPTDEEQSFLLEKGRQLQELGWIDNATGMKQYAQIDRPDDMFSGRLADAWTNSPMALSMMDRLMNIIMGKRFPGLGPPGGDGAGGEQPVPETVGNGIRPGPGGVTPPGQPQPEPTLGSAPDMARQAQRQFQPPRFRP